MSLILELTNTTDVPEDITIEGNILSVYYHTNYGTRDEGFEAVIIYNG